MADAAAKTPHGEVIATRDDAWRALFAMTDSPLSTNDPWIAAALTVIAFELAALRERLGHA